MQCPIPCTESRAIWVESGFDDFSWKLFVCFSFGSVLYALLISNSPLLMMNIWLISSPSLSRIWSLIVGTLSIEYVILLIRALDHPLKMVMLCKKSIRIFFFLNSYLPNTFWKSFLFITANSQSFMVVILAALAFLFINASSPKYLSSPSYSTSINWV